MPLDAAEPAGAAGPPGAADPPGPEEPDPAAPVGEAVAPEGDPAPSVSLQPQGIVMVIAVGVSHMEHIISVVVKPCGT